MEIQTDCRSETGITVGLIDSILTLTQVLVERDLGSFEVQEALRDLKESSELKRLLKAYRL